MHRVTRNSVRVGWGGGVLVIPVPGKKGCGLHPSGKELPEQRSSMFRHKNSVCVCV
jgi:hypothetical protein